MRFADVERMKESTFKKFVRLPKFDEHLALHRIDCLGSHANLGLWEFVREKLESMPPEQIRPEPLISGNDLIAEGHQPGPRFKEILAAVEDGQLEGKLQSREDALNFVRREFPASG
jgi:poly(A) polymerase